jgi:hypothetical protein
LLKKEDNYYNIFNVLRLQDKEVTLHSRIIADLLNPYGEHGNGDVYQKLFISLLNSITNKDLNLATQYQSIEVEKYLGKISEDYENGGFIDIILCNKSENKYLIIENKIFAEDQEKQLLRYFNYSKRRKFYTKIIYLCVENKGLSNKTLGSDELIRNEIKKITTVQTYSKLIKPFIEKCLVVDCNKDLHKVVLKQYLQVLDEKAEGQVDESKKRKFVSNLLNNQNHLASLKYLPNIGVDFQLLHDEFKNSTNNESELINSKAGTIFKKEYYLKSIMFLTAYKFNLATIFYHLRKLVIDQFKIKNNLTTNEPWVVGTISDKQVMFRILAEPFKYKTPFGYKEERFELVFCLAIWQNGGQLSEIDTHNYHTKIILKDLNLSTFDEISNKNYAILTPDRSFEKLSYLELGKIAKDGSDEQKEWVKEIVDFATNFYECSQKMLTNMY